MSMAIRPRQIASREDSWMYGSFVPRAVTERGASFMQTENVVKFCMYCIDNDLLQVTWYRASFMQTENVVKFRSYCIQ